MKECVDIIVQEIEDDHRVTRVEVHSFESGAYMIDIWTQKNFYCSQIYKNTFGYSKVEEMDFSTIPDHVYATCDELIFNLKVEFYSESINARFFRHSKFYKFYKMKKSLLHFIGVLKKVNNSVWIEWTFRILISLVFIKNVVVTQEEYYPDSAWVPTFIALWLYFFKQRLIGLIPLISAILIHFFHVSPDGY